MVDTKETGKKFHNRMELTPHHGRNVRTFREFFGWTQDDLGEKIGFPQHKVSQMESLEIIDDDTLGKIADVMRVPVELLKTFTLPNAVKYFTMSMQTPTLTNTSSENSHDTVNQQIVGEQQNEYNTKNIYNDYEHLVAVYDKLLDEKDKRLAERDRIIEEYRRKETK